MTETAEEKDRLSCGNDEILEETEDIVTHVITLNLVDNSKEVNSLHWLNGYCGAEK